MLKITLTILLLALSACSSDKNDLSIRDVNLLPAEDVGTKDSAPKSDSDMRVRDLSETEDLSNSYAYLPFAARGERCQSGSSREYLILSDLELDCQAYAQKVDAYLAGEVQKGVIVFEPGERDAIKNYCFSTGEDCEEVQISVEEAGANGTWSATIKGVAESGSFSVNQCDGTERRAPTDISITDVAIYQAVKIPIIKDTQFVDQLNAPIISRRPGLLRVFVNPDTNWRAREIVAKVKIGQMEKEARLTPTTVSHEGDKDSTFSFEFEKGELPTSGDFSVELFESALCSDEGGTPGVTSLPRSDRRLEIRSLNKSLDVVLVPITYNYDGSGRTPDLNAATVQTYSDLMYEYYPVDELNVSVRAPAEYDALLGSRGSGFPEAINFCLNLRQVDGVADDVFYYCVFKPAETFNDYCGFFGCRAGQSLIPDADESESRGAVGISFPNLAAETFVHEIGHAMGRYHTPCGNAPVPDPNYPYAGGSIGSYGYSVFSKLVLDATANKDFMAYCKPAWVSDYTYSNLFVRLQSVLGTQSSKVRGPKKLWRSAVFGIDTSLAWSFDRELKFVPDGRKVSAQFFNANGEFVSDIDVYVRGTADSIAAIFTIENLEADGWIDIEGYGRLDNRRSNP